MILELVIILISILILLVLCVPIILLIVLSISFPFTSRLEKELFPEIEEHHIKNQVINQNEIRKKIENVFLDGDSEYHFMVREKENTIYIDAEKFSKYNFHYKVSMFGNEVIINSFCKIDGEMLNTYRYPPKKENISQGKYYNARQISAYNRYKKRLIIELGGDYKTIAEKYINKYSNSSKLHYKNPYYKYIAKHTLEY